MGLVVPTSNALGAPASDTPSDAPDNTYITCLGQKAVPSLVFVLDDMNSVTFDPRATEESFMEVLRNVDDWDRTVIRTLLARAADIAASADSCDG